MPLSSEVIEELKVIYRREYGKALSDQEAWAMGYRLAELGRILVQHAARGRGREEV
jgi:hypothetical protein